MKKETKVLDGPKMILACDLMGTIGVNGDLAYKTKKDMQFFKKVTENSILVMGRLTYESLPNKKLKNREIVILSSRKFYKGENGEKVIHSMSALKNFIRKSSKQIFISGGKELYETLLDECNVVYLTLYNNDEKVYDQSNKLTAVSLEFFQKVFDRKIDKIDEIKEGNLEGTILSCQKQ